MTAPVTQEHSDLNQALRHSGRPGSNKGHNLEFVSLPHPVNPLNEMIAPVTQEHSVLNQARQKRTTETNSRRITAFGKR